jgi:hypothetical protein
MRCGGLWGKRAATTATRLSELPIEAFELKRSERLELHIPDAPGDTLNDDTVALPRGLLESTRLTLKPLVLLDGTRLPAP